MKIKGVLMIFLITIFLIAILNSVYADTSPTIGENQAKKIAQNYLNSHNLPYKVAAANIVLDIKNKKTGAIKWVSSDQAKNLTGTYIKEGPLPQDLASNYQWDYAPSSSLEERPSAYVWKVSVINSQESNVGAIYIDSESGKIFKTDLKPVNNTNSNQALNATNTTNVTNQTSTPQEPSNTAGIILATSAIILVAGAGYWIYNRR